MPYHGCCCVINCKNTWRNSKVKFFSFPKSKSKWDQRIKWINAVKRINVDGSEWIPKKSDKICSAHFIDNIKSNNPLNPSYVPLIFPEIYKRRKNNLFNMKNRYNRLANRRKIKAIKPEEKDIVQENLTNEFNQDYLVHQNFEIIHY